MASWAGSAPKIYSVVTGFFPETEPKEKWAANPRPMLVCGTARDPDSGQFACRVAYGTSQMQKAADDDLKIANLSALNQLGLKCPTCFVLHSGRQMAILPWTEQYFRPWSGKSTPILSVLPEDMQRYAGYILAHLDDLPQFN